MTDVAYDIARLLNQQTGDLLWMKMAADSPGTNNLFAHDWPDKPDLAGRVVKYEGGPPIEVFGNPLWIRQPRVQITVRGLDSVDVLEKSEAIFKFLSGISEQELFGTMYQKIKGVGEPFEIGPDSTNRERAVTNFEVHYYDSI